MMYSHYLVINIIWLFTLFDYSDYFILLRLFFLSIYLLSILFFFLVLFFIILTLSLVFMHGHFNIGMFLTFLLFLLHYPVFPLYFTLSNINFIAVSRLSNVHCIAFCFDNVYCNAVNICHCFFTLMMFFSFL